MNKMKCANVFAGVLLKVFWNWSHIPLFSKHLLNFPTYQVCLASLEAAPDLEQLWVYWGRYSCKQVTTEQSEERRV
jgi:hypothetical protein